MTLTFGWPWPLRTVLMEYKHVQLKDRENMMFYSFDLDLDPMTLVLKLDLDMVQMYLHLKNEVPSYSSSKVIAWTDRHTYTQTDTHTHRQTRVKLFLTAYAEGKNTNVCLNNFSNALIFSIYRFGISSGENFNIPRHIIKKIQNVQRSTSLQSNEKTRKLKLLFFGIRD